MNFPKYESDFVKEMTRRNYSKETIKNYISCLRMFFDFYKTKEHPIHINEFDIKNYLGRFKVTNTQRSQHGAIKKFYEICIGQKEKFKYIPYARKEQKLPIVLSQDEVQKMFNVCENTKHKLILSLLYGCGLRVSELINLKWKHIDRSRMVINIIEAKGKKDRQVMLPPTLITLLEKYYYEYKSKEYVLNGQFDIQYTKRSVGEVIKKLGAKAGINKRVWTHQMRHNSFTHLAENGTDINIIQRLAGHSSVKTTSIYLHLSHTTISKINSPLNFIKI